MGPLRILAKFSVLNTLSSRKLAKFACGLLNAILRDASVSSFNGSVSLYLVPTGTT